MKIMHGNSEEATELLDDIAKTAAALGGAGGDEPFQFDDPDFCPGAVTGCAMPDPRSNETHARDHYFGSATTEPPLEWCRPEQVRKEAKEEMDGLLHTVVPHSSQS